MKNKNSILRKVFSATKKYKYFFVAISFFIFIGFSFSVNVKQSYAAIGDGVFIYDQTTPTTNVQSRFFTNGTKAVSAATSPFAGSGTSKHIYTRSSEKRNEIILGIQDSAGLLTIYKSTDNGVSWVSQWTATVGDGNLMRFGMGYEQNSGNFLVAYSANVATTNEIKYQTWDGVSWSGALNYTTVRTTGIIYGIKIAERSNSDELGIVWVDSTNKMSTNLWTGTAWYGEPTASLCSAALCTIARSGGASPSAVPTRRGYDISFESLSGDLMVVWGNDSLSTTQTDPRYIIKTAGGAWGAAAGVAITNLTEDGEMIDIASSPISDKIALSTCSVDTGADCNAIVWSGTAWGSVSSDTTSAAAIIGESSNNVEWLVDGTNEVAIMTYSDSAGGGIDWRTAANGTTIVAQTDNSLAPAIAGLERAGFAKVNPNDSREAIFIFEDANADIFVKRAYLTGTTVAWSNPTGLSTAIETAASVTGFNPVGFAFVKYLLVVAPTVTTQAVSSITDVSAIGNGNVTSDGGGAITERGFVWNTSTLPTTANSKVVVSGTTGAYTGSLTGLTGGTFYYVRAYAINSAGTSYGNEMTFTTLVGQTTPTIVPNTPDATNFGTDNTPTLEMTATDTNNDNVQYDIQIGTDPTLTTVLLDKTSKKRITLAGGNTPNAMAYSYDDGVNWTGLGTSQFISTQGIAYNGTMFVAAVSPLSGTDSLFYSYDGISWTLCSGSPFTVGRGVAWNGNMWVAVGTGTHSIATSPDGINWTGVTGTTIFSSYGYGIAWNGSLWLATGAGTTYSMATSPDGTNWTAYPASKTLFSTGGFGVAWNGTVWVVVGGASNTVAYSYDALTWYGLGATVLAGFGYGVSWNGTMFVAVGQDNDTIHYSYDGITWYGVTAHIIFPIGGYGRNVAWNGNMWVATGVDSTGTTNTLAYSPDGINWTGLGTTMFSTSGSGVSSNSPSGMTPSITLAGGGNDFLNTVTPGNLNPFNSGQKVSYTVSALDALTSGTYYWRARAKDPFGSNINSAWTTIRSFTIASAIILPTVTTQAVSSVAATTATGNGNITVTGGENNNLRGVVYHTATHADPGNVAPASSGYTLKVEESGSFGTGTFTESIVGLTGNITYYVRAYSHNSAGYFYGPEVSFTTLTSIVLPTVTTQAVSSITATTATGNGNITVTGGENNNLRGVVYHTATHADPGNVAPASSGYTLKVEESGSFTTGAFTESITGLTDGITYYVRAYSHNSAGYFYGSEVSFIAAPGLKQISGNLISSVFDTTANSTSIGYNSIMWMGTLGSGNTGKVRFQLAAANSITGPWSYYGGSTCGSLDWFDAPNPSVPVELKGTGVNAATCRTAWNNKRYFRYKVQICSNNCTTAGYYTPVINKIIVNWSS